MVEKPWCCNLRKGKDLSFCWDEIQKPGPNPFTATSVTPSLFICSFSSNWKSALTSAADLEVNKDGYEVFAHLSILAAYW